MTETEKLIAIADIHAFKDRGFRIMSSTNRAGLEVVLAETA